MKSKEKIDLVLKELYQKKGLSDHFLISSILRNEGIPLTSNKTVHTIARRLAGKGLIDLRNAFVEPKAKITLEGIQFCETTSFAYKGHPIITYPENSL